jgi:hypothetical protein
MYIVSCRITKIRSSPFVRKNNMGRLPITSEERCPPIQCEACSHYQIIIWKNIKTPEVKLTKKWNSNTDADCILSHNVFRRIFGAVPKNLHVKLAVEHWCPSQCLSAMPESCQEIILCGCKTGCSH